MIFILPLWEDNGNSMEAVEEYNLFALDNRFCWNNTIFPLAFQYTVTPSHTPLIP